MLGSRIQHTVDLAVTKLERSYLSDAHVDAVAVDDDIAITSNGDLRYSESRSAACRRNIRYKQATMQAEVQTAEIDIALPDY